MTMVRDIKMTAIVEPTPAPTAAAGNSFEFSAKIQFIYTLNYFKSCCLTEN